MINSKYKWKISNKKEELFREKENNISFKLKPLIKKLLISRGIGSDEKIEKFLNGTEKDMYNPYLIKDMEKAVSRIEKALENEEKVTIYGDYDVDGITSTTVIYSFLKKIGMNVNYYIPNRLNEGYGMNKNAIKKIAQDETDLIITVDTGITARDEVEIIKDLGMEVVITDHHELTGEIPNAVAVVDSKRLDDEYPFRELAGVGVAFKLVKALDEAFRNNKTIKEKYESLDLDVNDYLEFVCLGTISDVVPLVDENRIIVKEGIKRIKNTQNIGLRILLEMTIGDLSNITARDIAFMVVPKLNAAGRIDDAKIGVELFTEDNEERAREIAKELIKKNDERKKCEQKIYDEAVEIIEKDEYFKDERIIVVKNEGWHHGVIGIVASRLAETYFKPIIIFNQENNVLSGSARTMGGVNIFEVIEKARETLNRFGGHEGAAGLSLDVNKFEDFKSIIIKYANENITDDLLIPYIDVDMEISPDEIDLETIEELKLLEPFGAANEEPVFKINAKVVNATLMGKNEDHLRLKVKGLENSFDCVGFYKADLYENIVMEKEFMIIGTLSINEFNGNKKVQMMLNDMKSNMLDQIENKYNKSLYEKYKLENIEELLAADRDMLVNRKCDLKILSDEGEINNFIEKTLEDAKIEKGFINSNVLVVNNKIDLERIISKYENEVSIFYKTVTDMEIENALKNEGKSLIILSNNISKIVDLTKKYTIIYVDSLESYKSVENLDYCIIKDDVVNVFKRLQYLVKINKNAIYIDELMYNLKNQTIFKVLISLEILKELGIIEFSLNENDLINFDINVGIKNPIENSKIYNVTRKV